MSEFSDTYVLVLTVWLNVLTVMIVALGNVSGAHFNSAANLAIMLSGRDCCSPRDGACYIATQLVAGVFASYTYAAGDALQVAAVERNLI